jgi:hypothetical protein
METLKLHISFGQAGKTNRQQEREISIHVFCMNSGHTERMRSHKHQNANQAINISNHVVHGVSRAARH